MDNRFILLIDGDNFSPNTVKFMINDKRYTYKASLPDYFKKLLQTKRLSFLDSKENF